LLDCPLCERAERPDLLEVITPTLRWDELTMPDDLRVTHRLKRGIWCRVVVQEGQLRVVARTNPVIDIVVGPDATQYIPPETDYSLRPIGPVRFAVELYSVPARPGDLRANGA